jgi:hypothetical protein
MAQIETYDYQFHGGPTGGQVFLDTGKEPIGEAE